MLSHTLTPVTVIICRESSAQTERIAVAKLGLWVNTSEQGRVPRSAVAMQVVGGEEIKISKQSRQSFIKYLPYHSN